MDQKRKDHKRHALLPDLLPRTLAVISVPFAATILPLTSTNTPQNVSTKMSIALLPDSVTLSRRMCSDSVNKMLVRKQSITMDAAVPIQVEEESRKRVKVARSLQATHRVLERKMSADNVKSLLENRPSVEQLRDYGIYPKHATGVAASLQEKHSAIDKHVRRKSLEMSLHTRPSLEEVGYLHKPAKRGPAYGDGNVDENR